VITVYGGTDAWKQRLGFQSPDAPTCCSSTSAAWCGGGTAASSNQKAYDDMSIQVAALAEVTTVVREIPLTPGRSCARMRQTVSPDAASTRAAPGIKTGLSHAGATF